MNITEAIKVLELHFKGHLTKRDPDFFNACYLGVKALEYIERSRNYPKYPPNICLQGETLKHIQLNT